MLTMTNRLAIVLLGLLLAACEPSPEVPPPERNLSIEASYRLLFNGNLVGHALFALNIDDQGAYRLEAFTTPAGTLLKTTSHEIMETSRGTIDAEIRPMQFEHSVMDGERIDLVHLDFDWEQQQLNLRRLSQQESQALAADTQDRLSYLLAARRLALAADGVARLRIVSAEATEDTLLTALGTEHIEVPLGRFEAVGINRRTPDLADSRTLWFDTKLAALPLRIVRQWDSNTVEMQMETLVQPASE